MEIKDRNDLFKIRAFSEEKYQQYSLTSLTAYCVYWLHRWKVTTSLETVAVASHRMFPMKFGMVGWPEFPDITRTNRSVLQMRPKYRNLATSAVDKGVFLNQRGIEEAESLASRLGAPVIGDRAAEFVSRRAVRPELGKRARSVHPESDVAAVRSSQLFQMYVDSRFDQAEAIELVGLLKVYDHTPSSEKRAKLKRLLESATDVKDEEVAAFLHEVEQRFRRYLNR